jgi:hypothetical protein
VTHQHDIKHALVLERELVLAQKGHALVGVEAHVAGRGLQQAGEDFHEGGFACAVGADEAVAVPLAEFDGNVFEQGLGPELHGDVGCDEHGSPGREFAAWERLQRGAESTDYLLVPPPVDASSK